MCVSCAYRVPSSEKLAVFGSLPEFGGSISTAVSTIESFSVVISLPLIILHACTHTQHTHIYTHVHVLTHTYIHTPIHTHTHMYACIHIHTYTHPHTHTCMHAYTYICKQAHMHIHMYSHMYAHSTLADTFLVNNNFKNFNR